MEKIGIAICDDERMAHEEIELLFKEYRNIDSCRYVIYHCFSALELFEILEKLHVILLDIDMPKMDGIQVGKKLRFSGEEKCIIMLTSKRERFKEAFKIGASRFVTKPIEKEELYEALDNAFLSLIGYESIKAKYNSKQCSILQREIQVIESHRDFLKIYTKDKEFESNESLKSIAKELDENLFVLSHRSYLINLIHVCAVREAYILMDRGMKIPISRRNMKEVVQKIVDFDKFRNL